MLSKHGICFEENGHILYVSPSCKKGDNEEQVLIASHNLKMSKNMHYLIREWGLMERFESWDCGDFIVFLQR